MKKVLCIIMMTLIGIFASGSGAMAVSYQYTGNIFTNVPDPDIYCCFATDDFVSATLSFDNWLPANYSGDVSGLSGFGLIMTAGQYVLLNSESDNVVNADISTNGSGEIETWSLSISNFDYVVASFNQPDVTIEDWSDDYLNWTSASVMGNPGTWTVVPEPISSTLFLVGSATLGFRRFRKKFKK